MMVLELEPKARPIYCAHARVVYIVPGIYFNRSLREFHDALYGSPDPAGHVEFITHPDALFLSRSTGEPALRTGTWPKCTGAPPAYRCR